MSPEQEALHLAAAVRTVLATFGRRLATAIRASPTTDISQLLARYDLDQALTEALTIAQRDAEAAVARVWLAVGASAYREQLLTDIALTYAGARDGIVLAITQAFNAIPVEPFVPGVSTPGHNPTVEAGRLRSIAARRAAADFAAALGLRNSLTISTAGKASETAKTLAEAQLRADAGENIELRWVASMDGKDPRTCGWCHALHGTQVPVGTEFPHPEPIGKRKAPRLYLGHLFGPPLHPRCRCKLVIIAGAVATPPATQFVPTQEQGDFVSSDTIKAMPEDEYNKLHHFLRSALHELGQVLHRLLHPHD